MHSLPVFLRLQDRPVLLIGNGEAAEAKRRILERAGAKVVGEGDASLAIVALEDDAEADTTVAALKARGVLVNAVDRPALCDFTLPAIVDRDPVLVAIGTGGVSAGLAAALRQQLEAVLPATLGALALKLADSKAGLNAEQRRAEVAAALTGEAMAGGTRTETLTLASADPDDLTLRQARWLAHAERVYHAADVPAAILDRARADAPRMTSSIPADPGSGLTLIVTMGLGR